MKAPGQTLSLNSQPEVGLSVVMINYKMCHHLDECFSTIFDKTFRCTFEVLLVNKPSDDGTEELIRGKFPGVTLISHEKFGIAEMRNVGINNARGRYILMLDADTVVLDGAFDAMVDFMENHPDVGGAGAKTLKPDGTLEYNAKRFYTLMTILIRRTPLGRWFPNNKWDKHHLMLDKNHDEVFECDWMAGACYLMRRETIEKVGTFDDSFYFGFEDVDWCYRAKKAGWKIMYIPHPTIVHHVQRSSAAGVNRMAWEHLKSGWRFYLKHRKSR
jgi:GT2 family glycosyltransferase